VVTSIILETGSVRRDTLCAPFKALLLYFFITGFYFKIFHRKGLGKRTTLSMCSIGFCGERSRPKQQGRFRIDAKIPDQRAEGLEAYSGVGMNVEAERWKEGDGLLRQKMHRGGGNWRLMAYIMSTL
jgi:hypothetical protein